MFTALPESPPARLSSPVWTAIVLLLYVASYFVPGQGGFALAICSLMLILLNGMIVLGELARNAPFLAIGVRAAGPGRYGALMYPLFMLVYLAAWAACRLGYVVPALPALMLGGVVFSARVWMYDIVRRTLK